MEIQRETLRELQYLQEDVASSSEGLHAFPSETISNRTVDEMEPSRMQRGSKHNGFFAIAPVLCL